MPIGLRNYSNFRRSKRVATKPPIVGLSDSASEHGCSSSSEFEPDDENMSESDADVGNDADADDLHVGASKSYTG